MMNFKQYLIERNLHSRHELTYHKLLSAIDTAHVDKKDSYYEFNLGMVTKDSTLNNLMMRVQRGSETGVKLGQHKDGRMFITVFVKKLPERGNIDGFLDKDEKTMHGFVHALNRFFDEYPQDAQADKLTSHEQKERLEGKRPFEEKYNELLSAIDKKMEEYTAAIKELEKHGTSVNAFKRTAAESAKTKLKNDYVGGNSKEFVKKMSKLPEAEFIAHLDKEIMNKLTKRLENYYEHKF